MRSSACLIAALALAGCGGGDSRSAVNADPQRLPNGDARGATIVSGTGCLACHRLGSEGAGGPGPDLTDVGARLSREEIEGVLRDPVAPMPDYDGLPAPDFAALVDYLTALR